MNQPHESRHVALPRHESGPVDGPHALLVHGLGASSRALWRIAVWLEARGWRVVSVDLRGHGAAPDAQSYGMVEHAADLAAVHPGGDGGSWDLVVGHSLGGAASIVAAATEPGWADRLVLIEPVLLIEESARAEVIADQLSELNRDAATLAAEQPGWNERDVLAKAHGSQTARSEAVEGTIAHTAVWDFREDAARLKVPALVLRSDPLVFSMLEERIAAAFVAANPRVSVVAIDGAGHGPHRDRPEQTLTAIAEFLGPLGR
ncbi:alpha/beta fold hydrolase [Compostimonas suwonensis]|uniref:Alpha-beta hydrolase superfamily lysophospholipase n=1 Tax=Compostimonas suwonensis TaxID=1048394 RepID=A0A2M9C0M5_9MICO|nr:alpha/beta hydrolase [Compostimonas suwonensis]PJJ63896.1 alpha-beta hydrolase superfamily lysophospholipase [Compostimonas suwonensis]